MSNFLRYFRLSSRSKRAYAFFDTSPSGAIDKSGNLYVVGNLKMTGLEGYGVQKGGDFGWKDLIGSIQPKTTPGPGTPDLVAFRGNIYAYQFSANDVIDFVFHIPHDYLPTSDLFIHVHWGHNGTAISGSFVFDFYSSVVKGFSQGVFPAEKNQTLTVSSLAIATTPQYAHRTDEIQLSTPGGSASLLDSTAIETDSLLLVRGKMSTVPTITGGTSNKPFVFTIDIHYQSTGAGSTPNKAPGFYDKP